MATIFAYTSPARGHLYPLVPTLLALRSRGHTVHVRTLADEVERMRALGLEASAITPLAEGRPLDDWRAQSPLGAMDRTFNAWLARAEHEVADVREGLATAGADLCLVDVNSWGALAAAEASGTPFAVFAPYFLNLSVPGRPPFGLGLRPATGWLGRLRDRLIGGVVRLSARPYLRRLNALRRGIGLGPLAALDRLTERAHRVLSYTAEPFEYGHGGWPANVRLVGPGIWEPASPPVEAGARPLVLVTCSTEFQDDGRLLQTALDALAEEDVEVVATSAAVDPAGLRVPANARVVRFAAHGPLLARAAAVVCHGGMGITQKALAAGVPVCVVPWGRDQLDVAQHVEVAGVGAVVPRGKLDATRLREAVRVARGRRAAAEAMARAFQAGGGPERAADVVEALLAEAPARA